MSRIRHNGRTYRKTGQIDRYEPEPQPNCLVWVVLAVFILIALANCGG